MRDQPLTDALRAIGAGMLLLLTQPAWLTARQKMASQSSRRGTGLQGPLRGSRRVRRRDMHFRTREVPRPAASTGIRAGTLSGQACFAGPSFGLGSAGNPADLRRPR